MTTMTAREKFRTRPLDFLIRSLKTRKLACLDLETTSLDARTGKIIGIAWSWWRDADHIDCVWLPLEGRGALPFLSTMATLKKEIFSRKDLYLVAHNWGFDLKYLAANEVVMSCKLIDTMLAAHLLDEAESCSLDNCAEREFGLRKLGSYGENFEKGIDSPEFIAYGLGDAVLALMLWRKYKLQLERQNLMKVFFDVDVAVVRPLVEIELTGFPVKRDKLKKYGVKLRDEQEAILAKYKERYPDFNIGSTEQVSKLLFDRLRLRPPKTAKRTKKGFYSTATDTLEAMKGNEVVDDILRFRHLAKYTSTYVDRVLEVSKDTGRVYIKFFQAGGGGRGEQVGGTATGRLSSDFQNIPRDKEVRECFGYDDPDWRFIKADLCLSGNVRLETSKGLMPIKDVIKECPFVLTCDEKGRLSYQKVNSGLCTGINKVYRVEFEDGSSVECTLDHKWMNYEGILVETRDLKPGTRLMHVKKSWVGSAIKECASKNRVINHRVKSITYIGRKKTYQISVDKVHYYVLENGLVSSNCQIEMRIIAHVAKEPTMIKAFIEGEDIYQTIADECGIDRQAGKGVALGTIYTGTPGTLKRRFMPDRDMDFIRKAHKKFHKRFPGISKYHSRIRKQIETRGYVQSIARRRRRFPPFDVTYSDISAGTNHPIQGSSADLIKIILRNIYRKLERLRAKDPRWRQKVEILHTVHDEIDFGVHKSMVKKLVSMVKKEMEAAVKFRVPITVDIHVGDSWYEEK